MKTMTAAERAAELLHTAKVESDSTDPVEYTAQAVRNLVRDDATLGPVFAALDIDAKLELLYVAREIVVQGTGLTPQ